MLENIVNHFFFGAFKEFSIATGSASNYQISFWLVMSIVVLQVRLV